MLSTKKTLENHSKIDRQIDQKTYEKSSAKPFENRWRNIGKTSPTRCQKGFASELRHKAIPRPPERVTGMSQRVPRASRKRPEASVERPGNAQERPKSVPERSQTALGACQKRPESSKIAPKASLTDLWTILAPFWLVQGCLWTCLERFFRFYVGVHG